MLSPLPGPCLLARSRVAGNPDGFSLSSQEESGSLSLIHRPTWNQLLYRHPPLPRAGGDNREEGPSSRSLAHTQLPREPPGHLTSPPIHTPGPRFSPTSWVGLRRQRGACAGSRSETSLGYELQGGRQVCETINP